MSLRSQMRYMNPYAVHRALINEYVLKNPGDTKLLRTRDTSKDKRDFDIIRENHKFLWEDDDTDLSWEQQFAKKYYEKLFKEYCITDLTYYKENKIAMRWRIEKEVVIGKGQFICGNKMCKEEEHLRTWEVNFAYTEDAMKKNALVKLRLCPDCSKKLNYHNQKREVKRIKSTKRKKHKSKLSHGKSDDCEASTSHEDKKEGDAIEESPWESQKQVETKTREEEMDDYLRDLLL